MWSQEGVRVVAEGVDGVEKGMWEVKGRGSRGSKEDMEVVKEGVVSQGVVKEGVVSQGVVKEGVVSQGGRQVCGGVEESVCGGAESAAGLQKVWEGSMKV